jgi:LuxR family maltose regulon positive regulatory protein
VLIEKVLRLLSETAPAAGPERVKGEPPHAHDGMVEPLTAREIEVLRAIAKGQTYDEIAAGLVVSINTVRTHIKSIYGKLGVNNRTEAIATARSMQIL